METIAMADIDTAVSADPAPEKETRKQRVADALLGADSTLERFPCDGSNTKHRHIELNSGSVGGGIQINLFDDEASVSISYGLRSEAARDRFHSLWAYLETMHREGGYFVFDPQLGRVLKLKVDFSETLAHYEKANQLVSRPSSAPTKKNSPASKLFPLELDRLPYFCRWCALSGVALLAIYIVVQFTLHTRMEALVLIPGAGWFLCKMLLLDAPRLRSIGWSPRLTFISVI